MKVRTLPFQPHCFAFGGFEIQMLSILEALRACGVDAEPMNVWDRDANFDVLHVWGLDVPHLHSVYWARRAKKRVVMSALLPFMDPGRRLKHMAQWLLGPARLHRQLLDMVDVLVVVCEEQAETACRLHRMPRERMAIIPNLVATEYFAHSRDAASMNGDEGYVLCTGNICPRKNQLNLAKAAVAIGSPLVLVGNLLTGEEAYGEALSRSIEDHPNVRWFPGMEPGSPELIAAYRKARVVALPSFVETQPVCVLEAAALRKGVVIADAPYAKQSYYDNACRVKPQSVESIAAGLRAALDDPQRYTPPLEPIEECRSERVGLSYRRVFEMAMADPR